MMIYNDVNGTKQILYTFVYIHIIQITWAYIIYLYINFMYTAHVHIYTYIWKIEIRWIISKTYFILKFHFLVL